MGSNVTNILETIVDDLDVATLSALVPEVAPIFKIPIIGTLLADSMNWLINKLIAAGVIEAKLGIIAFLSSDARAKYAAFMPTLEAIQSQPVMTPEQLAEYEKLLQNAIENHNITVNA